VTESKPASVASWSFSCSSSAGVMEVTSTTPADVVNLDPTLGRTTSQRRYVQVTLPSDKPRSVAAVNNIALNETAAGQL
jgi:hypothetical protein